MSRGRARGSRRRHRPVGDALVHDARRQVHRRHLRNGLQLRDGERRERDRGHLERREVDRRAERGKPERQRDRARVRGAEGNDADGREPDANRALPEREQAQNVLSNSSGRFHRQALPPVPGCPATPPRRAPYAKAAGASHTSYRKCNSNLLMTSRFAVVAAVRARATLLAHLGDEARTRRDAGEALALDERVGVTRPDRSFVRSSIRCGTSSSYCVGAEGSASGRTSMLFARFSAARMSRRSRSICSAARMKETGWFARSSHVTRSSPSAGRSSTASIAAKSTSCMTD